MAHNEKLSEILYQYGDVYMRAAKELHPLYCKSEGSHLSLKRMEEKKDKSEQILLSAYGYSEWISLKKELCGTSNSLYLLNTRTMRFFNPWGTKSNYNYCMEGAIHYLRSAINENPRNTKALYLIASLNEFLGNYDDALKHLNKLLKLDSNHSTGLFLKTKCLRLLGRNDEAKKASDKLSKLSGYGGCSIKSKSHGEKGGERSIATKEGGDDWLLQMKYGGYR